MEDALDVWFEREVLSHEDSLVRYLTRVWPNAHEVHDLRQEIYVRVYEAAGKSRPYAAKSFLFTTARHLMTDRLRRNRIVSIEAAGETDFLNVLVDEVSPEQQVNARQELKRVAQALDLLSPKCRRVVWMRKVEDISQREVAERLGIDEKTVEKHVAKGVRVITDYVFGSQSLGDGKVSSSQASSNESQHGKQRQD
jgi:RNA polymerase sigma-70 factor (ECF subfamily)